MNQNDLVEGAVFTVDGKNIWELRSYCLEPTCELVNIRTSEVSSFGLGGLTAEAFTRIQMPIIIKEGE